LFCFGVNGVGGGRWGGSKVAKRIEVEGEGEMASENTVVRRGATDDFDLVTQVVYEPVGEGGEGWTRYVERIKLFRRSKAAQEQIALRKQFRRFGAATGAVGPERGVTMVAVDATIIEDPLSEEAGKTGEELMIERLKATVKSKGTHREADASDFESFSAATSAGTPSTQRAGSNSRYRGNSSGQSPGRLGGAPRNSSSSGQGSTNANGGRNSPMFPRSGQERGASNIRGGQRSPPRGGQRSPTGWNPNRGGPSPARRDGRNTPPPGH
jgi:hypothetical protein